MEELQELHALWQQDNYEFEDDYEELLNKYDEFQIQKKSIQDILPEALFDGYEIDEVRTIISSSSSKSDSIKSITSNSEESLTPACLQDIIASDSELKFFNLCSFYPVPEDPNLNESFWILYPDPPFYQANGIKKFFDLAKLLNLSPVQCLKHQLLNEKINLKYYGLDPELVIALSEAIVKNITVKSLNLQENFLTVDACYNLNKLLLQNHVLSSLNLTACKIGVEGAMRLEEGISNSSALKELNLSHCELGNEGLYYVARAAMSNTLLQSLNISHNNLDEDSTAYIQQMLVLTESLEVFNLSWNNFNTKQGAEKLFAGLKNNTTLIDIDISWNSMAKESAYYIKDFLSHTKQVQYVNLEANRFTDSEALQIANGLILNKSLLSLNLNKNPFGSKGITDFIKLLLSDVFSNSPLLILNFENLWATKDAIPILNQLKEIKPNLNIKLAGILENFTIIGPDLKELFFKSANFEAMSPKKKKERKNFGHFVLSLGDTKMSKEKFVSLIEESKIKISENLAKEITNQFLVTKKSFDQAALKESYMTYFPDTKLPQPKKPKIIEKDDITPKKDKKKGPSKSKKGKKKKK